MSCAAKPTSSPISSRCNPRSAAIPPSVPRATPRAGRAKTTVRRTIRRSSCKGRRRRRIGHPDGRRLFIACANGSSVWVYDTFSGEAIEQVSVSLFPDAPLTATPNSLALSPDGKTMLVANADNNAVAVVDVSNSV